MLKKVISAVVMAAVVAVLIAFAPSAILKIVVLAVIAGGLHEFVRLVMPADVVYRSTAFFFGLAAAAALLLSSSYALFFGVLIAGLFTSTLIYMRHSTTLEGVTSRIALTLFAAIYIGATIPFIGKMANILHGRALIFMAIGGAAMSDTFAMFAGKAFGRTKFAPLTSPNKTWEGFICGIIGSVGAIFFVRWVAWQDLPFHQAVLLGIFIGIIGPLGDLIESLIKRDFHVKDSGSLIPGHGGLLDRLDALTFVSPFVYWYAVNFLSK